MIVESVSEPHVDVMLRLLLRVLYARVHRAGRACGALMCARYARPAYIAYEGRLERSRPYRRRRAATETAEASQQRVIGQHLLKVVSNCWNI